MRCREIVNKQSSKLEFKVQKMSTNDGEVLLG